MQFSEFGVLMKLLMCQSGCFCSGLVFFYVSGLQYMKFRYYKIKKKYIPERVIVKMIVWTVFRCHVPSPEFLRCCWCARAAVRFKAYLFLMFQDISTCNSVHECYIPERVLVGMFTLRKWLLISASPTSIIISSGWTFLLSPFRECSIYIMLTIYRPI